MNEPKLVTLDSRKRVSLGRLGARHDQYFVYVDERGIIVLTPAVVLIAEAARINQHKKELDK